MIGGGDQHNQIPTSAGLNVDARILPESKVDDIVDEIKQVIGPTNFLPHQGPNGEELLPELALEVMAYRKSYHVSRIPVQITALLYFRRLVKLSKRGLMVLPLLLL